MSRSAVGNDVVDLGDPWAASALGRDRFVRRVLSPDERARLRGSADPTRLLWSAFAAKEAAYKVACKLGPPPPLAHREFITAPDLQSIRFRELVFQLRVQGGPSFVHALAWLGPETPTGAVETCADVDAGRAARARLCADLAQATGCGVDDFRVIRDPRPGSFTGFGPPRVLFRGDPAPLDVSLSHDGPYLAWAHLPT
jgi:phosphopantetheinyl transferase (holo-ACP synthase)